MNFDAMLLSVVALADMALIFHLRRVRRRREREHRMMRCLEVSLQRETGWQDAPPRNWYISHAG